MSFRFVRVHPEAQPPQRANPGDAGYDLASCEYVEVPARGRALVDTGLVVQIPPDCYARVAPRSGLSVKHGILVGAGVVDSSYTGVVKVLLHNTQDTPFQVYIGDRIAQLVLERIYTPVWEEAEGIEDILPTSRGAGGFGSTGT